MYITTYIMYKNKIFHYYHLRKSFVFILCLLMCTLLFVLKVGNHFLHRFRIINILTIINIFYLILVVYDKLKTTLNVITENTFLYN